MSDIVIKRSSILKKESKKFSKFKAIADAEYNCDIKNENDNVSNISVEEKFIDRSIDKNTSFNLVAQNLLSDRLKQKNSSKNLQYYIYITFIYILNR